MIKKVGFVFLWLSYTSWHCRLTCLLLPFSSHNFNFLRNECHIYVTAYQPYQHGLTYRQTFTFLHKKNGNIILCVENEECISDLLSEELNIDSDDGMNLENEGQSVSDESSNASSES
jgi:hypothetical protein